MSVLVQKNSHMHSFGVIAEVDAGADAVMILSPYIEGKITLFDEDVTPAQKGPKHIDTYLPGPAAHEEESRHSSMSLGRCAFE